ncbi:MAG: hypothetical protein M3Q85_17300, partial [Acidobacteriota bacterium]|nr:hypothetical protein [Acidobacteriota bacterium]
KKNPAERVQRGHRELLLMVVVSVRVQLDGPAGAGVVAATVMQRADHASKPIARSAGLSTSPGAGSVLPVRVVRPAW